LFVAIAAFADDGGDLAPPEPPICGDLDRGEYAPQPEALPLILADDGGEYAPHPDVLPLILADDGGEHAPTPDAIERSGLA
jgi:hypothetical protein